MEVWGGESAAGGVVNVWGRDGYLYFWGATCIFGVLLVFLTEFWGEINRALY